LRPGEPLAPPLIFQQIDNHLRSLIAFRQKSQAWVVSKHARTPLVGSTIGWSLVGGQSLTRRIELGTQREGLLDMFDEDAYFGGHPAAGRPNRKDRLNSFERSQKTDDSTFPEFRRE
jgi:hypothetical protein